MGIKEGIVEFSKNVDKATIVAGLGLMMFGATYALGAFLAIGGGTSLAVTEGLTKKKE